MGKTIVNHPFGNGLYHINGDDLGMVYYCFTHITNILMVYTTHKNGDDFGMFIILSLTTLLHMVVLQLLK